MVLILCDRFIYSFIHVKHWVNDSIQLLQKFIFITKYPKSNQCQSCSLYAMKYGDIAKVMALNALAGLSFLFWIVLAQSGKAQSE